MPQKIQTPARRPYRRPSWKLMLGVLRYMARLADMMRDRIRAQPKIFPLLPDLILWGVKSFSFIQAFPKRAGEYQTPPRTKAEMPATATAIQLGVINGGFG